MLPNGWENKKIGDFIDFKNGVNADKDAYGEGIKFVNVMDVFGHDFLLEDNVRGSMSVNAKQQKDYSVSRGDILFNRTSETEEDIARTAVYMDDKPIIFGGFVIRGRQNKPLLLPEYAGYCFRSSLARKEIIRRGQGGIRTNISQKDLALVSILIPPKREQRAISDVLIFWDKTIESVDKLIKEKHKQKKALMQRLLTGEHRFPEFEGQEWQEVRLGDLLKERRETKHNKLPLLSITRERGIIPRDDTERKDNSNVDKSKYLRIHVGDIGYNTMRMWQGVSALSTLEGIVSPAYTILAPTQRVSTLFASYLFKYTPMVHIFERHSQGMTSDTWSLKYPVFKKIKVKVPSVEEQQKIAAVLSTADEEINLLTQKLEAYQAQKKGLMQQLLTGKKRVKTTKKEAA